MVDTIAGIVTSVAGSVWMPVALGAILVFGGFVPGIPSGTTLLTASAVAASAGTSPFVVGLAAIAGAIVGDVIGHQLGSAGGTRILAHPLLRRVRRPVFRARGLVRRHPAPILFAGRFLPGGRITTVLAAGTSRVPLVRFLPLAALSATIWTIWMVTIGTIGSVVAGGHPLGGTAAAFAISASITAIAAVAGAVKLHLRRRRRRAVPAFAGVN